MLDICVDGDDQGGDSRRLSVQGPASSHEPTDMTTSPSAPVVRKWPQVGSSEVGTPLPSPQPGSSRSIVAPRVTLSLATAVSAMGTVICLGLARLRTSLGRRNTRVCGL